ncbi:hypothetical protein AB833_24380 [Chromatiales bacterium (ex Bugula neritina AB1)]|nr:hypothetical protein AB833_24380 [Chromatiales bacterium (ex Bugula neritina AB1)]
MSALSSTLLVLFLTTAVPAYSDTHNINVLLDTSTDQEVPPEAPEIDFGEEGDVILKVFLRDILLTDGLFAIMREGRVFLPLAELSSLLDFPIVVDVVTGKASGWYLEPKNTFSLDIKSGTATTTDQNFSFTDAGVFTDDIDLFVDSFLLQQWLPLFFDVSLSAQILNVRSTEKLSKELARERSSRNVQKDVRFAATREYYIPDYRFVDWPEVNFSLGGFFAPESEVARYDYRVRAVGDFAFLNGKVSISGSQDQIAASTVTLGRSDPRGMFGPLRVADFEVGDTSQFLPGMIGSSLSGRGLRFGNTRLANQRDLDSIDLQGEQQSEFEVELYVNDRLRGVDRDSQDSIYDFQNVPLQLGQNEIRLEFYGPQGQRFTETTHTFIGGGQGRKGNFDYEFAVVEPGQRLFDLFDETNEPEDNSTLTDISLSSALNVSYGLTERTSLGLTVASLATDNIEESPAASENSLYVNAKVSTDVAGVLMSSDLTVDPNGKVAGLVAARTTVGKYELGVAQRLFQRDFRDISAINSENTDNLTRSSTSANLSRRFFGIPSGRLSYGANAGHQQDQAGDSSGSLGARIDYQTGSLGLSWSHNHQFDFARDDDSLSGQVGARFSSGNFTQWSFNTNLIYNNSGERLLQSGSLRAARPLGQKGYLSLSGTRDLELANTAYTASWNKHFQPFKLSTSVSGTSSEDISVRVGLDLTARRYPNRLLPSFSSSGSGSAVAVLIFGDDNQNGKYDKSEPLLEGIRLTRNGLLTAAATDKNGVALLTGLSSSTSVDIGIVEADIKDPSLKYSAIEKGILPRPGRVPVLEVALQRATDIEGTVTVAGDNPAPNVRMVLTPVDGGKPMEIYTEYDGYYYLSHVPLGVYEFGPDSEQLESAGLVAQPATRQLVLENLDDFPPPEDFNLLRIADLQADTASNVPELASAIAFAPDQPVDSNREDRKLKDRHWVLAQKSDDYTIQINSSVDRELLLSEAQVIVSSDPLSYFAFKKTPSGRPVYGLANGVYDSAKDALDAISKFPDEMKVYQPWVRQFNELQQQIESNNDSTAPELASTIAIDPAESANGDNYRENDRKLKNRHWVLAQKSDDYTIQISSSVDRELLLSEAQAIASSDPLSYFDFKKTPSGRPVYGLAIGVYDSAYDALDAISKFPDEMKVYQPWVRQFNELQQQIESNNDSTAPELASAIAINPDNDSNRNNHRKLKDRHWVLAQKSNDYTIQINSSVDRELLLSEAQVIVSSDPLSYFAFKKTPSGRPVYGLAIGVYDSAKDALDAISKFPDEMKLYNPWVRQFNELQRQIKINH